MQTDKQLNDQVTHERWQTAQAWEHAYWQRERKGLGRYGKNVVWRVLSFFGFVDKYRGDDRNLWWMKQFDGYSFLPSSVNNALEVGCGAYTNIRLIRKVCELKHLYLSDPLIRSYVTFPMTLVSEMYRDASCCIDDHPIEELPFADNYFDLVVMINVLDHVRDAQLCMNNIIRVTKPGGIVIIGQDLTNEDNLRAQPAGVRTGHPITLKREWFDPYLNDRLETVLLKDLTAEQGVAPEWHYATLVYAGRKLPLASLAE